MCPPVCRTKIKELEVYMRIKVHLCNPTIKYYRPIMLHSIFIIQVKAAFCSVVTTQRNYKNTNNFVTQH